MLQNSFILTKWNVNNATVSDMDTSVPGFILTKWNVNQIDSKSFQNFLLCFILTKWNVNFNLRIE